MLSTAMILICSEENCGERCWKLYEPEHLPARGATHEASSNHLARDPLESEDHAAYHGWDCVDCARQHSNHRPYTEENQHRNEICECRYGLHEIEHWLDDASDTDHTMGDNADSEACSNRDRNSHANNRQRHHCLRPVAGDRHIEKAPAVNSASRIPPAA